MKNRAAIFIGLFFLLGACANKPGAKPPAAMRVDWAGTIRLVNTAENFVLVESESPTAVIAGEKYLSVHDGRETGALRITDLRAHPFLIADIVSGNPSTGDKIYIPRPGWTQQSPAPADSSPQK